MTSSRRYVTCARCGLNRPHESRGLCKYCYRTVSKNGTRDLYPAKSEHQRLTSLDPAMEAEDLVREVLTRLHKTVSSAPTLSRGIVLQMIIDAGRL